MKIYDVTRPLGPGMAVYPGDLEFFRETTHVVEKDGYRLTNFRMSAHCGTHMDAPAHFIAGGATIEDAPLELLMGEALVLTVETGAELATVPEGTARLLMRANFRGLTGEMARALLKKGVRLLGTTAMSVAVPESEMAAHVPLLAGGCWIVENLELGGVADGRYHMVCLPMKLAGVEGAPARVVLVDPHS
jgi:arylformamidase